MHLLGSLFQRGSRSRSVVVKALLASGLALGVTSLGSFATNLVGGGGVPTNFAADVMKSTAVPRDWQLVRGKHWQIVSAPSEDMATTDMLEGTRGACPAGMVEAKGHMKLDPPSAMHDGRTIEQLQKTTCTKWINREYPERCAQFDRDKWLALSAELQTKPMDVCIDRYEYPNLKGVDPIIMVSWHEASDLCAEQGKRLCDEAEWTFACEGEEATPYPYGYTRDAAACVVDQPWRAFNEQAMRPRDGAAAGAEMNRLWQGVPSGSRPRCRSSFGVYDLTGNVDEWTRSVREGERPSILKGGYWGPVRTRCRPSTRAHDENHMFYQQGARCCADPGRELVPARPTPDPATSPLPRELR